MNMREKMAWAMMANGNPYVRWEDRTTGEQRAYLSLADAALSALAEPTEAMIWAAMSRPIAPQESLSDLYRLLFQTMIGAAGEG